MIAELSAPRLIKTDVNELAFTTLPGPPQSAENAPPLMLYSSWPPDWMTLNESEPAAFVDGHVVGIAVGERVAQKRASLKGVDGKRPLGSLACASSASVLEQHGAVGRGYDHVSSLRFRVEGCVPRVARNLWAGAHSGRRVGEKARDRALDVRASRSHRSRQRRTGPFGVEREGVRWMSRRTCASRTETVPCLGSCEGWISHRDSLNVVRAANEVNSISRQDAQPAAIGAPGAIPQA